jgi:hypothetical protein
LVGSGWWSWVSVDGEGRMGRVMAQDYNDKTMQFEEPDLPWLP